MPTAPSRDTRAGVVGAVIALAYLRLLAEGDWVRAAGVLASYQGFWNIYRASILLGNPNQERFPNLLPTTGVLDSPTTHALAVALVSKGVATQTQINQLQLPRGAAQWAEWYRVHLPKPPPASAMWNAYQVALNVAPQDANVAVDQWSFSAVEGLGGAVEDSFGDLIDTLARDEPTVIPGGAATQCGEGMVWDASSRTCVFQSDVLVTGVTSESSDSMAWGWWLLAGAGALAAFGLGWRIWKKPRRRR